MASSDRILASSIIRRIFKKEGYTSMRVGVIGAGSIGLLFAAYLSQVFDVTVYTRSQEQANEIDLHGISLLNGTERTVAEVKALPITDWQGLEKLTIIAVKQYQLFSIIERLK